MMSPQDERRRLLSEAVKQGGDILGSPVDAVSIRGDVIEVRAGLRRLRGRYGYSDSFDASGNVLLGGGSWWVDFSGSARAGRGWLARLFGAR